MPKLKRQINSLFRNYKYQVERYGLEIPDGYYQLNLRQIQRYANGCGSEAMSEIKRKALTAALKMYEAAFFIHDICYEIMSDKEKADYMMKKNMITIMKHDFGTFWFLTKKGLVERFFVIPSVYATVVLCGGRAYQEAKENDSENITPDKECKENVKS